MQKCGSLARTHLRYLLSPHLSPLCKMFLAKPFIWSQQDSGWCCVHLTWQTWPQKIAWTIAHFVGKGASACVCFSMNDTKNVVVWDERRWWKKSLEPVLGTVHYFYFKDILHFGKSTKSNKSNKSKKVGEQQIMLIKVWIESLIEIHQQKWTDFPVFGLSFRFNEVIRVRPESTWWQGLSSPLPTDCWAIKKKEEKKEST